MTQDITPTEAGHVVAVFGDGSMHPGGFITKLLEAAAVADIENLAKLGMGFPGYIEAVRVWKWQTGGDQTLREIADGTIRTLTEPKRGGMDEVKTLSVHLSSRVYDDVEVDIPAETVVADLSEDEIRKFLEPDHVFSEDGELQIESASTVAGEEWTA